VTLFYSWMSPHVMIFATSQGCQMSALSTA